jgi:hypothetical protein
MIKLSYLSGLLYIIMYLQMVILVWVASSIGFIFLEPRLGEGGGGQSGTLLKEQCCHHLDNRLWGTKGLSVRPTCFGTEKSRSNLLFYSILCYSTLFYSIPLCYNLLYAILFYVILLYSIPL